MKKFILSLIAALTLLPTQLLADEGMWLLQLMRSQNLEEQMRALGLEISVDEIYSPDAPSLKDAIGIFGGGCTGEIVSPNGLIFTNHHCGYSYIQQLSAVEHNYLKDGFWAQDYKDELSSIAISGTFTAKIGEKPTLEITDGSHTVKVTSDFICQQAQRVALDKEKCKTQLKKTGATAYFFESLSINTEDSLSLPLSVLNAMRRDALNRLDDLRAVRHNYKINDIEITEPDTSLVPRGNGVRARMTTAKFSPAFKACELIYVPIFTDNEKLKALLAEGFNIGVEIPRGLFKNEERIAKRLGEVKQLGINDALCSNLAAVYMAKAEKMRVHGGFGLNLVNTYDLLWAEEYGLEDAELSFELTFERINRLGGRIARGIITYGHLPLMLTVNCPAKSENISCKSCKNSSEMTDRRGEKFPLKCDGICTEVLNCVPLYIADKEISGLSTSFHTIRLTVENYVETVESICEFTANPMLKVKSTRGLYIRGVK